MTLKEAIDAVLAAQPGDSVSRLSQDALLLAATQLMIVDELRSIVSVIDAYRLET